MNYTALLQNAVIDFDMNAFLVHISYFKNIVCISVWRPYIVKTPVVLHTFMFCILLCLLIFFPFLDPSTGTANDGGNSRRKSGMTVGGVHQYSSMNSKHGFIQLFKGRNIHH